jgi:sarcosine oxidase
MAGRVRKIDVVPAHNRRDGTEWHQCVVIGAGLLGLSAAWALSRRGWAVTVLEPGPPGHARSGSKGTARIFRLGYPEAFYVQMALQARDLWRSLEEMSGTALLHVTGQVTFGAGLGPVAAALNEVGASFEYLTSDRAADRFPQLGVHGPAIVEAGSGVLVADECLRALRQSSSFELRTPARVDSLHEEGDAVVVVLHDGQQLAADVVVNCAGPRALPLMGGVRCPMAEGPSLQQVAYFATSPGQADIPIFIEWDEGMIYGLPVIGQPLYKVSHHTPGPAVDDEDVPMDGPGPRDDHDLLALLSHAARRLLPTVDPVPVATERCLYDNTRDTHFIIDRVGRIVIGCGTSGHGFKFGPLLGELLADLATGSQPAMDLSPFALKRSFLRGLPTP